MCFFQSFFQSSSRPPEYTSNLLRARAIFQRSQRYLSSSRGRTAEPFQIQVADDQPAEMRRVGDAAAVAGGGGEVGDRADDHHEVLRGNREQEDRGRSADSGNAMP